MSNSVYKLLNFFLMINISSVKPTLLVCNNHYELVGRNLKFSVEFFSRYLVTNLKLKGRAINFKLNLIFTLKNKYLTHDINNIMHDSIVLF